MKVSAKIMLLYMMLFITFYDICLIAFDRAGRDTNRRNMDRADQGARAEAEDEDTPAPVYENTDMKADQDIAGKDENPEKAPSNASEQKNGKATENDSADAEPGDSGAQTGKDNIRRAVLAEDQPSEDFTEPNSSSRKDSKHKHKHKDRHKYTHRHKHDENISAYATNAEDGPALKFTNPAMS